MNRDYTHIPGYEGLTPASARYNYLHDLMEDYKMLTAADLKTPTGCRRKDLLGGCQICSFSGHLGGDIRVSCNWRAEENPDRAITILEFLRAKEGYQSLPPRRRDDATTEDAADEVEQCHRIADHCGLASQMDMAEEEAAELIQALSKYRRACAKRSDTEAELDAISEEMADVYIMLGQLSHLLQNKDAVAKWKQEKLSRTIKKIEEGEL